jgi:hypothetical protein
MRATLFTDCYNTAVRLILEPTNTTYCRTVDLTDKDTFAEQVITKPGTQMVWLVLGHTRTSACKIRIFFYGMVSHSMGLG